jgi:hypothetical protein
MDIILQYRGILISLKKTGVILWKLWGPRLYTGSYVQLFFVRKKARIISESPSTLPLAILLQRGCREVVAIYTVSMLFDPANDTTRVEIIFVR